MENLLDDLDDAERRQLLSTMRRRKFRRDEIVCHEGDLGDSLHLVAKGRFAATITSPVTGQAVAVNLFERNDYFGELALLGPSTVRAATVSALEVGETLELRRGDFELLLAKHPGVGRFLLAALAQRVREMTDQLGEVMFMPVEKRVHRRLLMLEEMHAEGDWIVLRQEELAMMAGTTRPTVNRILRKAEELGVVELRRGRLRVLDGARLRRLAR